MVDDKAQGEMSETLEHWEESLKSWAEENVLSIVSISLSVISLASLVCCIPRSLERIRRRALYDYDILRNSIIEGREGYFHRELTRIGRDIEYLR